MTRDLGLSVRNKAFDLSFTLISYRINVGDVPRFPGAPVDKRFSLPGPLTVRKANKKIRGDKYAVCATEGGHEDKARCSWLVPEPVTRCQENEEEDQGYYYVVLPGGPWKIPENQTSGETRGLLCGTDAGHHRILPES